MRSLAVLALLVASPALWAQSRSAPKLPVIDQKACPFECCRFGRWTATADVPVYDKWQRSGRKPIFTLPRGEAVTAITGVHITYKPGHIRISQDMDDLHLHKGQVVSTYMYRGEGYIDFWANGAMQAGEIAGRACSEAGKQDATCVLDTGEKEWWIEIKTDSGRTGWVEGNESFSGTDACG